jgi:predicted metal-dependent phosphoesterase TrpH
VAIDLHTHSERSDGSDPPEVVVAHAAAAGLSAVALTDHDTLDGIAAARAAAAEHGIELVPGTELSVDWPGGAMHMLVYFLEPGPGPLQERLAELQDGRHHRNLGMVADLQGMGIDVEYAEVEAMAAQDGVVGRPHLAAVLVRKGAADSITDAFDRYLARGRPAYRERPRLGFAEAARLARESGAVPVVAHPHTIGVSSQEYEHAFRTVAGAGIQGIEAHYGEYTPEVRVAIADLAGSLGLVATGGSDYHGTFKEGVMVGTAHGDLEVPERALAELKAVRG